MSRRDLDSNERRGCLALALMICIFWGGVAWLAVWIFGGGL